jgi:hypothetical protein
MKTVVLALFIGFTGWGYAQQSFGDSITAAGAMTGHDLGHALYGADSLTAKVKGTVSSVCQKKGCWMTMDLGHGQSMRITFKDYGFFVPKDCAGRTTIIEGVARKQVISVEEQRHYAEDEGKSAAEIEMITQPKTEITFEARGVLLL